MFANASRPVPCPSCPSSTATFYSCISPLSLTSSSRQFLPMLPPDPSFSQQFPASGMHLRGYADASWSCESSPKFAFSYLKRSYDSSCRSFICQTLFLSNAIVFTAAVTSVCCAFSLFLRAFMRWHISVASLWPDAAEHSAAATARRAASPFGATHLLLAAPVAWAAW